MEEMSRTTRRQSGVGSTPHHNTAHHSTTQHNTAPNRRRSSNTGSQQQGRNSYSNAHTMRVSTRTRRTHYVQSLPGLAAIAVHEVKHTRG